jgi:2',3'-cyclic-nucleotide 2'-phosphodiesterase (5'-nucleotidase family)
VNVEFEKLSGKRLDDTIAFMEREYPDVPDDNGAMVLGTNIAASYRKAAIENFPEVSPSEIVGMAPMGVIRKGLKGGAITNKDAFEVLSLGENEVGRTGYPLVCAWIT